MGLFVSKNINFAFKIFLLRRREFFVFLVDFCDNFGPPKSQRVIKWKSYLINSQIISKHIPYDLNISSKVKQKVSGTIEIWRKCPSTEALWGGVNPYGQPDRKIFSLFLRLPLSQFWYISPFYKSIIKASLSSSSSL